MNHYVDTRDGYSLVQRPGELRAWLATPEGEWLAVERGAVNAVLPREIATWVRDVWDVTGRLRATGYTLGRNGRIYPHRFDHDAARKARAGGESVNSIAKRMGVNATAVGRVVDEQTRARMDAYSARWQSSGVCQECGASCTRWYTRCADCGSKRLRKRFRTDDDGNLVALRCATCRNWKHHSEFGPSAQRHWEAGQVRKIRNQCRPCGSAARAAFRRTHTVPCLLCGRPVEGTGRANTRGSKQGGRVRLDPNRPHICAECWRRNPKAAKRQFP